MSGFISSALDNFFKREYALLKEGKELLRFQSFFSFDTNIEANTTNQPVEQGSFFTANKVIAPSTYTLELGLQGNNSELLQAIQILENEVKDASFIQVITPFYITPNATVTKMSWTHKEQVGALTVSLQLQEIKEVIAEYTHTKPIRRKQAKNTSDTSSENGGKTQGKEPRKSVLTQLGL